MTNRSKPTRWLILLLALLAGIGFFASKAEALQIANTVHNLSVSGPGTVKAVDEERICIFCHTPHDALADAPLWNRYETTTTFTLYPTGGSMQAVPGQPNGSTRLCLSCHDGTAAVGLVHNPDETISMYNVASLGEMQSTSSANLGTSLADDHPVSMIPSLDDPEISLPVSGDAVQLDSDGYLQCRSCHNPHDNTYGYFLVASSDGSEICVTCHTKNYWTISEHGATTDPTFAQLLTQACSSCHDTHSAPVPARLLVLSEETLCFACHDGVQNDTWETSGATDIITEFQKSSVHPITLNPGTHDPGEGPIGSIPTPSSYLPEQDSGALRHVECVDCHNPHSANTSDIVGGLNGALANVWGIAENGTKISPVTAEYQICFKCHGDSENLPSDETNKRLEFQTTNASYHPVLGPGTNTAQGSLISPLTPSSTIKCTDCHGSDNSSGPQGPHGSSYSPLLKANYNTTYGVAQSTTTYALCYECHDESTLGSRWSFKSHTKHIMTATIPCIECHDVHGVADNTHLMSWPNSDNVNIEPSSSGRLEFIDNGSLSGTCYVNCHGRDHNPKTY